MGEESVPDEQEPEQLTDTIGDIGISPHWVVTPSGHAPIGGSRWNVVDRSRRVEKHPWWTIVLAVLLFPIGLLFLLIKNVETIGFLEISVASGTLHHDVQVPVRDSFEIAELRQRVNRAQTAAAAAS